MFCCGNCFGDRFLSEHIKSKSARNGACDFCGTESVDLIEPAELADTIQQVIDLYEVSAAEESVVIYELLRNDWHLFEEIEGTRSIELLDAIYPGTDFGNQKYVPKAFPDYERISMWDEFQKELKHHNRYFPKRAPDPDHLKNLFSNLIIPRSERPERIYRARCNDKEAFTPEEMLMPPGILVDGGRANPVGIPYLYAASEPNTAIAEVRPYKSDIVSVVEISVLEELILADLRNPRKTISPFELTEELLGQMYVDIEYLSRLGEDLSKPVLPREAHIEYLSTQYLCELIKNFGYDGVVYRSSVGMGDNYAIFDISKLKPSRIVTRYKISETTVITDEIR